MAFTGRAIYDTGVFNGVAEDVSDIISMISPFETPLLDRLAQAPRPAANVLHEWLEEDLNPNTIVASETIAPATTSLDVVDLAGASVTGFLQAGAIIQDVTTGEYVQVTAIVGNALTVTRGFGGTTAATIVAGGQLFVVSDAALEGADVVGDISRPRTRVTNFTQIFKKDIIVSGTVQNVTQLGNVTDEMDHQRTMRLRESLRDLEKATIRGKASLNSLGSSTAYRTMKGLLDFVSTNATSVATISPETVNDIIKLAWDGGATDLDLIVCDSNTKRKIDSFNQTRVDVANRDTRYHNLVSFFESTYGTQEVILSRWMPADTFVVLSTQRVHVVPLQGRSFQFVPVSRTGDAEKGMTLGEYTLEVKNEGGLAQGFL